MVERVLITGVGGYLGSCMAYYLLKESSDLVIIGIDNLSRAWYGAIEILRRSFKDRFNFYKLDLRDDREALREVIQVHEPEAVIHFAALTQVSESLEKPAEYYLTNVHGTWHLLDTLAEVFRDKDLPFFVYSSSAAVYGIPESVPIPESAPLKPVSPYGATKVMGEQLLRSYSLSRNLKYVALRYFNPAGSMIPLGEHHEPETHLIPRVIANILKGRPIQVYGNDYDTPDGTPIRDFIHVQDLISAHLKALDGLLAGTFVSETFNVGRGEGYSVLQVVQVAQEVLGKKAEIEFLERRAGDPPVLIADPSKFNLRTGFKAELNLNDMISSHYEFLKYIGEI